MMKKIVVVWLVMLMIVGGMTSFMRISIKADNISDEKTSGSTHQSKSYTSHAPIYINGNSQFTAANGVTGGSGTESDPYIIEGWGINASSGIGIHIQSTDLYFIIRNCYIHDGWTGDLGSSHDGIYLQSVTNGIIDHCTIADNLKGIYSYDSPNNQIIYSEAYNNAEEGVYFVNSLNNTLSNSACFNNTGDGVYFNTYQYTTPPGSNKITDSIFYNNSLSGIHIRWCPNNIISNCTLYNNYDGIHGSSTDNNQIANCSLYNNYADGIYLRYSDNNTIVNCSSQDNRDGMHLSGSQDCIITYCSISNNYRGILICRDISKGSNNNLITYCNIGGNTAWGIYIYYDSSLPSNYNKIHHCNFNNAQNAYDCHTNYWDNSICKGNYWGDYNGSDDDSDGIGDLPYDISGGGNQDRYPMMDPLQLTIPSVGPVQSLEEKPEDWYEDVRVSNDIEFTHHPVVATDSKNNMHVVWEATGENWRWIHYKNSTDGGKTWSEEKKLHDTSCSGHTPSITIDKNDVIHVVWSGGYADYKGREIFYTKSTDGGISWSETMRLTYADDDSFTPKIATYENTLHLVWVDERWGGYGHKEICYKRSVDGGKNWSEDLRLTNTSLNDTGESGLPSLAVDSMGSVHIAWYCGKGDKQQVYYTKSGDGSNWTESLLLNPDGSKSWGGYPPAIAVDSYYNLYVIWEEGGSFKEQFYYKKWERCNNTWSQKKKLTNSPKHANSPSLVIDSSDTLHLIWDDYRDEVTNLWYKKSADGTRWTKDKRITYFPSTSWQSALTIDSSNVLHLVWVDHRDDIREIYYKRTLNPVTEPPIIVTLFLTPSLCKPGSAITVSGAATYNATPVANASITIKIVEIGEEWITITDGDGNYNKTISAPSTPDEYTIRVTVVWGNWMGRGQRGLTVEKVGTYLTYIGDTEGYYSEEVTLTARLVDIGTDHGIQNKTITFTLGNQTVNGITNEPGIATATLMLMEIQGNYTLVVEFPGDNYYLKSVVEANFTIKEESQPSGEKEGGMGFNTSYLAIIGGVAAGIIIAILLRMKKPAEVKRTRLEKPVTEAPTLTLRCPQCKQTFTVENKERPFSIKCPHCGKEGTIGAQPKVEPLSIVKLRCPSCKKFFEMRKKGKPFRVKCPHCGKEGVIK
ncbi:MAG: right-handed parallel beta-helix repeat-containing protein [Thermoplasmatales archaeon]|nr:right-handed parallel beta-helix repeat-containing protein [Thermoplasmatales archaeon]